MSSEITPRPVAKGDHVFLVDGSGYIFRAYHALPPLTRKSDGMPVGAVSGFCNMLWKLLRDADSTAVGVKPTHIAVVFDASAVTFRNAIFDNYKAHRPDLPEDLKPQFAPIREAVRALSVACVEQEGYEADDIIATYTRQAREAGADVTIVSSDKDLMQLVEPCVILYDTMKDRRLGREEVFEKFGVYPEKVIDVQALAGDAVDNVPGVPGIGVKTAAQLITEFGDLETLLAGASGIKQQKRRENLIEFADQARLSRRLVELDQHVPLECPIESIGVRQLDGERAIAFLKTMEFTSLTRRVAEATGVEPRGVDAAETPGRPSGPPPVSPPWVNGGGGERSFVAERPPEAAPAGPSTPGALAEGRLRQMRTLPVNHGAYETVATPERLDHWIRRARETGVVAFDVATTALEAVHADLVGVALCVAPGEACYVPLAHRAGATDLLGGGPAAGQVEFRAALKLLKPLLEDPAILKVAHNLKYDVMILARYGIAVAPADDTMLISYALDAGRGNHGRNELSERHLGHAPIPYKEVSGTGKNRLPFDEVGLERATHYAAEDADVAMRLWRVLTPRLAAEGVSTVYHTLERPLIPVLARMEDRGIRVDRQILSRLSGDFGQAMARLEAKVFELAGESFNIGSTKQLGDILFGKFALPGAKKTKTGAWATDADVLEELAATHDLPRRVLEWRQVSKLKSTYTDALPTYADANNRVHTCFSLASTTTGRLSSTEPNIQNIPIRTEEGRKIRSAFVADPGHSLLSADYSQIELRVLAHVADIPQLRQAFADGLDIHAMTASEMFGVPVEGMPADVRRRAKAINFGIIYGISSFGLANQLGIERGEAGDYIRRYFERFPGIRDYIETTKRFARDNGYVVTIFGRRANYPEIRSPNPSLRAFNERASINAPIQGSAADIIRRAMIRMDAALAAAGLSARMLLQVHDELVFEVPDAEVEATIPVVRRVMEGAADPAVRLAVPLRVDARAARNWEEAH